jgi:hypothetical protein
MTLARRVSLTSGELFRERETVAGETPNALAIPRTVAELTIYLSG